jgi:hypothetical protein
MDPFFLWIESSAVSIWLREAPSLWAFPFALILHTVGLAFLVGVNVAVDVRLLGLGRGVPPGLLERYFFIIWLGFWINAASGVALLIAYPTKALTNPLFYIKLALIGIGVSATLHIRRALRQSLASAGSEAIPTRLKMLAAASLACWVAAIFAGRLLAYTCTRLSVDSSC